tara:strand:- start:203 stop:589 length:387 start_codon:yes stop_codon:yes gene_type:complete
MFMETHPVVIAQKMTDFPQHMLKTRWAKFPDAPIRCHTCFDHQEIDSMGKSIPCPACGEAKYHPRSVEIIPHRDHFGVLRYWVEDYSQNALGNTYAIEDNYAEAKFRQRRRQGVIKAALTRRANKAVG